MKSYKMYTSRKEANKAFNQLCGIIEGISIDRQVNFQESFELDGWLEKHEDLGKQDPYRELVRYIRKATLDGEIEPEEIEDIRWVINNIREHEYFQSYDLPTRDLQVLQGLCHGILADGVIKDSEITGLTEWVGDHGHLYGLYPFDELVGVLTEVLADGVVDEDEKTYLTAFFNDLVDLTDEGIAEVVDARTKDIQRSGICVVEPEIALEGKTVVLTGESSRCSRDDFKKIVSDFGGKVTSSVSGKTDFLIVGADGNECWAYACYGRKIEKAVQLRKEGKPVMIVHENDFWDWVADNE